MKKATALAMALILSVAAFAQERKDLALGFTATVNQNTSWFNSKYSYAYNDQVTESTNNTAKVVSPATFALGVNLSIFAGRHFAITPQIEYTFSSNDNINYHVGTVGVGFHYYVPIVAERFYYTPGLDVNVGVCGAASRANKEDANTGVYFSLPVHIGRFEFKPTDHWGIHIDLVSLTVSQTYYSSKFTTGTLTGNTFTSTTENTTTNLLFTLNYGVSIGAKYYF